MFVADNSAESRRPIKKLINSHRIDVVPDVLRPVDDGVASSLVGPRHLEEGVRAAEPVLLVQLFCQKLKLHLVLAHRQLLAGHDQLAVT